MSPSERRFLFLLSSGRPEGNAELLARRAAAQLPRGTPQDWVNLSSLALPPFEDLRHTASGFPAPHGVLEELYQRTVAATEVVFVAPTYWYSLPAPAKLYLDHWSGFARAPGRDFRAAMAGRSLWLVTVNSDLPGEDGASEPAVGMMRLTARYMRMYWHGALIGHGNRPGDVLDDTAAIAAAERYFASPGHLIE